MPRFSKKHQEEAICPTCGDWKTTDFTPEELQQRDWECSDCQNKRMVAPEELPENRGSKEITMYDPEYEFLKKLVLVVGKAVPESIPEIKALSLAHPFETIDDAGDLAAQVWTLATEKYGIPREWLFKKLPEKKVKSNLKKADLKEYSNQVTKKVNDFIVAHPNIMTMVIEASKSFENEDELYFWMKEVLERNPDIHIIDMESAATNELIQWKELAWAWFNTVKRDEPLPGERHVNIENLPVLDKKQKLDELLDQLSAETDPQKKEQIKQHIERIKRAKLLKADLWPAQQETEDMLNHAPGYLAYQYGQDKTSSPETDRQLHLSNAENLIQEYFFEKGIRWSQVVSFLKKLVPQITDEDISQLKINTQNKLNQFKLQIDAKKKSLNIDKVVQVLNKKEPKVIRVDTAECFVELEDGSKITFDEAVKKAVEMDKTADFSDGFSDTEWHTTHKMDIGPFSSPEDYGAKPQKSPFPNTEWLPASDEEGDAQPWSNVAASQDEEPFYVGESYVGKSYRGNSIGDGPPTGKSAADIIRFEMEELENDQHVDPKLIPLLEKYPASSLVWVGKTKRDVRQYGGEAYPVDLGSNPIVIGYDDDGGYLVLKEASKSTGHGQCARSKATWRVKLFDGRGVQYFPNEELANKYYEVALKEKKDPSKPQPFTYKKAFCKKEANPQARYWIDPNGKEFRAEPLHGYWIKQNKELLNQYGINTSTIGYTWNDMLKNGWVRVSNEPAGTGFQIQLQDLKNIPSFVDNFIAKNYTTGEKILLGDQQGNSVTVLDPFPGIQDAVNKALRQPVNASLKQASSIVEMGQARVFVNPTALQTKSLLAKTKHHILRALLEPLTGDMYVWDAFHLEHGSVIHYLGLSIDPDDNDHDYIWIVDDDNQIDQMFNAQVQMKNKLSKPKKKADLSGQVVNDILKSIETVGGTTINLSKGNLSGSNNYAVSIYPERERIIEGPVDFEKIEDFIVSNEDLLNNANNSFGAWTNQGKVYLDVVVTIPDKIQALELARKNNQLAIWDLRNNQEIQTNSVKAFSKNELHKRASFLSKLDTEGMRDFLMQKGSDAFGKLGYEDVKEMVPSGGEWLLQDIPLSNFPNWTSFTGMNTKKRNAFPIVTLGPDFDWEVIDGKHRIAVANAVGEKIVKGYVFNDIQDTHVRKVRAQEQILTQEQQDQIAAATSPVYNIALNNYAEAVKRGHDKDRALAYAVGSVSNLEKIDEKKLVELANTYLKGII